MIFNAETNCFGHITNKQERDSHCGYPSLNMISYNSAFITRLLILTLHTSISYRLSLSPHSPTVASLSHSPHSTTVTSFSLYPHSPTVASLSHSPTLLTRQLSPHCPTRPLSPHSPTWVSSLMIFGLNMIVSTRLRVLAPALHRLRFPSWCPHLP